MQQLQAQQVDEPAEANDADAAVCDVWPEHWDAMRLLEACLGQFTFVAGMGGGTFRAARAADVRQQMDWLGIAADQQPALARLYLVGEAEALRVMNQQLANEQRRHAT